MYVSTRERPNSRPGFFRRSAWLGLNASALLALAACGGGGGGSNPSTPPANPSPSNVAPTARAGDDQTITLPTNSVQLQGSATDDGLPTPASLTYSWAATSGGNVTFSNASAAATTATFPAEGTYVLTLTVSDGALSGTDTVQVVVSPAAGGGNQPPVVQAGVDQSIELPVDRVQLTGSATDDGPAASLTYSWAATAGPAGVTFDNSASAATAARFVSAGDYDLTLTVSDGTQSATDVVRVSVAAAVFPAADNNNDNVPDRGWLRVNSPSDVGMDAALLDQARDYSLIGQPGGPDTGGAGFISRHGRLVYSWGNIDAPRYQLKSATKAVGGIALGLALDASPPLIDLAAKGQAYLPSLGTIPSTNDPTLLDDITILQLATHTAGFAKPMGFGNLVNAPGTKWLYSDGGLNWLADVLTQVHGQDLATLLQTRVWTKLGITSEDISWRDDGSGRTAIAAHPSGFPRRELASGITANTNAMARVGLLFLRRGAWAGERILSENFVDTVRTPRPENANIPVDATDPTYPQKFPDAPKRYGVLWWTNATGALGPDVPTDAYWAWGLGDCLIVVIPSLDLVVVRTGNNPDNGALPQWRPDWNGDYEVLKNFLVPIAKSVTP
jgi:CubicO group peptidase (beta-lactamase class C family)